MPDGSLEGAIAGPAAAGSTGGFASAGGSDVARMVTEGSGALVHGGASEHRRHIVLAVLVVLLFLALNNVRLALQRLDGFAALYAGGRGAEATVVWKTLQVLLVVLATMLLPVLLAAGVGSTGRSGRASGPGATLRALGVHDDALAGLAWAFVGTVPALLGFAWLGHLRPAALSWALVMTAVASPVSEELLYRGFLFRQLYQGARWPFWLAALANALPFALGHLYQVGDIGAGLAGAAGILVMTGFGAAFAGWLFARWHWNLWPAIAFHAFMNLWAFLFSMGESVVSTPAAIPFMVLAVVGTAAVTVWRTGGWRLTPES